MSTPRIRIRRCTRPASTGCAATSRSTRRHEHADRTGHRGQAHVEYRPVCPEVQVGLGVPRDTIRLVASGDRNLLVQPATGRDLTDDMELRELARTGGMARLVRFHAAYKFLLLAYSDSELRRLGRTVANSDKRRFEVSAADSGKGRAAGRSLAR